MRIVTEPVGQVELEPLELLDVEAIRRDFPILQREVHGRPLVYLDSAATSQKPESVIAAMDRYYRGYNANVHRGIYELSEEATAAYEQAHRKMAGFIHAGSFREIVFVKNATEALNLVAYSWGRSHLNAGDVLLLTEMEHHSNLVPWQLVARERGARLELIGVDERGLLCMEDLERLLSEGGVKLISITLMSNVLGTINPIREIADIAHRAGARLVIDGAQGVPHLPVDVREMGCDFLAFSGHKMLGPTGIGVLYGKRELLEEMEPFMTGGGMIREVSWRSATWNELPWKFEAGTPNIAEGIGLAAAADYLCCLGMDRVQQHEKQLTAYAMDRLETMGGIEIYGPPAELRGGLVAFNLQGVHPHDLATILDREGIAIRAGHHCAQPLHRKLGLAATARASFYLYNFEEEVDRLIEALEKARRIFKRPSSL